MHATVSVWASPARNETVRLICVCVVFVLVEGNMWSLVDVGNPWSRELGAKSSPGAGSSGQHQALGQGALQESDLQCTSEAESKDIAMRRQGSRML